MEIVNTAKTGHHRATSTRAQPLGSVDSLFRKALANEQQQEQYDAKVHAKQASGGQGSFRTHDCGGDLAGHRLELRVHTSRAQRQGRAPARLRAASAASSSDADVMGSWAAVRVRTNTRAAPVKVTMSCLDFWKHVLPELLKSRWGPKQQATGDAQRR